MKNVDKIFEHIIRYISKKNVFAFDYFYDKPEVLFACLE